MSTTTGSRSRRRGTDPTRPPARLVCATCGRHRGCVCCRGCGSPDCFNECAPNTLCAKCGYRLSVPLAALNVSDAGLDNDGRYPGRMIIAARQHYDHVDEMPSDLFADLMADAQTASRALRRLPGVARVNIAILSNQQSHVHVEVIPRRHTEPNSGLAPWDHAPIHRPLAPADLQDLTEQLRRVLRDASQRAEVQR